MQGNHEVLIMSRAQMVIALSHQSKSSAEYLTEETLSSIVFEVCAGENEEGGIPMWFLFLFYFFKSASLGGTSCEIRWLYLPIKKIPTMK